MAVSHDAGIGEVTARTFERQVVELHVHIALLNRFSQIGRPQTVPLATAASVRLGWRPWHPEFDVFNSATRCS